MKCHKAQKQLLTKSTWPEQVLQHVKNCDTCKIFTESVRQFQFIENLELKTPATLYQKTKNEAFAVLTKVPADEMNFIKKLWNSPRFAIGLAFIFLGIFIIAFAANFYWEGQFLQDLNWTILITIIIQNLIMAIFVPIFFSNKNHFFNISKRS